MHENLCRGISWIKNATEIFYVEQSAGRNSNAWISGINLKIKFFSDFHALIPQCIACRRFLDKKWKNVFGKKYLGGLVGDHRLRIEDILLNSALDSTVWKFFYLTKVAFTWLKAFYLTRKLFTLLQKSFLSTLKYKIWKAYNLTWISGNFLLDFFKNVSKSKSFRLCWNKNCLRLYKNVSLENIFIIIFPIKAS